MGKVFTGDGPIPPDLIVKIKEAELKSELCQECSILTQKLSKLFMQLEKIEMEVNSSLELVLRKLERSLKLGNRDSVGNFIDINSTNEWIAKLEITNALRKDAKEKCSRKLRARLPSTKLKRLTPKQIDKEKRTIKNGTRRNKLSSTKYAQSISKDDNIGSPAMALVIVISSSANSASTYSFNCLSRYLKLDMRKVFTGDGPIPPDLVAKVEKAGLRAELCKECAALIEKLSKQVRLLEKIEMEVNSGLESVREKLQSALKAGNRSNDNSKFDEWRAKLEITDALRKDAIQKCSRKLAALRSLTKLKRLTPKKVLYEKVKLRKAFDACRQGPKQRSEDVDVGSPAIDVATNEQGNDHDYQDEQDYYDPDPTPSVPILGEKYEIDAEDVKHEVMEDIANDLEVDDVSERQQSTSNNNKSRAAELTDAIPPPIKVSSEVGDGTAKSTASKKQKNRFVCSECKKDFNSNAHYQRHYLSIHMGVKYKCGECDKTFAQKIHLVYHQKSAHLGNPIQCKYCSKTFSFPHVRKRHMKFNCSARKGLSVADDG